MSERTPWYRIELNATGDVAEVYILDEISPYGVTAQDFIGELSGVTASAINLHLNTPGGDVYDGIAIYNALKGHSAQVVAFIPGLAASIGTVIAMAADRVVIAPHARMMIHDAWTMVAGNAEDLQRIADRLEATSQNIASIYAERAGETADYWRGLMKAETWYTDQQAVDAGLADEVGRAGDQNALKQAALFNLSRYRHGEREAARLRAEAPADDEPVVDEDTEPTEQTPATEPHINEFIAEREELEAAIAGVRI